MTWLLEKFDQAIDNPVQALLVIVLLAAGIGTAGFYVVTCVLDFVHRHGGG